MPGPSGTRNLSQAYESWIPDNPGPWFLTCDHASARLPAPWRWPAQDLGFVGQHWSYDLGAAALAQRLSQELCAPLIQSRFTRLLVDPNRDPSQGSFIVPKIGSQILRLNRELSPQQRNMRRVQYYEAYHQGIDSALTWHRQRCASPILLSVHSFTPHYQGEVRAMPGGVLFDDHEELAKAFCQHLVQQGWAFRENEPYSGYDGLIEGIARHGKAHNCRYLELEVRQDLACDPVQREAIVQAVVQSCRALQTAP